MASHHNYSRDTLPHIRRKQMLESYEDAKARLQRGVIDSVDSIIFSGELNTELSEKYIKHLDGLNTELSEKYIKHLDGLNTELSEKYIEPSKKDEFFILALGYETEYMPFSILYKIKENILRVVREGALFRVQGVLYLVEEILDGGLVKAINLYPDGTLNPESFTQQEVLKNMV